MLWLVLGTAALRVALAAGTGLGVDESYMVAAGRTLQLSYFDHPPLAWWLSRLAALAAGSEAPVVVRLPFVVLFALSTSLMFALASRLFGERAGLWAAVGLNLSPVFGVTTATWVLPDGPLVCALLAAAYCLVRALEDSHPWTWWLLAGLAAGLALLSKYSAALVLAGAFGYFLTQPAHRGWLARPQPYLAALVALACCTPVAIWNARHGWASVAFQGGRAATTSLHPFGPLRTLAGEALVLLPWIWLPLMLGWIAALRAGPAVWRSWLPACLGAGPVILFVVVSLWARNVLFHWAAPGYLMLFPLLGAWAERADPRLLRIGWQGTAGLVGLGCALLLVEARVNLLARFGTDPGLTLADWTPLRAQLADRLPAHLGIAATNWADTGKLDYALGGTAPVICLNPDARQFQFLPDAAAHRGQDLLVVGPHLTQEVLSQTYAGAFDHLEALPPLRLRGTSFGVFLGRGWHG